MNSKIFSLLEKMYHCKYPFLTPCVVLAVMTPHQLITNMPLFKLQFPYVKEDHKQHYKEMSISIHDTYFTEYVGEIKIELI